MTSRRWQWLLAALVALAAVVLSGCTSSEPSRKYGKCEAGCGGTVDGSEYLIKVPKDWNGTLLIYSHGYQFADDALHPWISSADRFGTGSDPVSLALLNKGYALAGSSWTSTGWAVQEGVLAADRLYVRFTKLIRKPTHAYAWGASLGGLVTEQLAEHSQWVDGAAAMCGVVGGPLANFDNWLQAAVATEALLGVNLTITGPFSQQQATAEKIITNAALVAARRDKDGDGKAKLAYLADLVGLPDKSQLFFHDGLANDIGAAAQNLGSFLANGLRFLAEAREQFDGNPAQVHPASEAPLTADQRATIVALHGNPDAFAAQVGAAYVPPTSSVARQALAATGTPTGKLRVPTITLHGVADPLAVVANESVLRSVVADRGRADRLEQLFLNPNKDDPAGGLTHCAFSLNEQLGLIDALDQWVRQGSRPKPSAIADLIGPALARNYSPPRWPSGAVN